MEVSRLLIPEDYLMGGWRGKGMFLFTAYVIKESLPGKNRRG
jgi:hypothetical protein